jgi:uncharacterized protein (TIGR03085 family)
VSRPLFDASERAALCDLLAELGPDAPTVLTPWTTRDIAIHLFLREHDPVAGPGLVVPGPWSRLAQRHHAKAASKDYAELVATVRAGPSGLFRLGWLRRVPNLNELFVHHEDVRRANGGTPRALDPTMDEALWHNVRSGTRVLARRLRGCALELHNTATGQTFRARRGPDIVRISGEPGELLLYLFGRQGVADVRLEGPTVAVQRVRSTRFGL